MASVNNNKTCNQLRQLLEAHGAGTSGKKATLVARLVRTCGGVKCKHCECFKDAKEREADEDDEDEDDDCGCCNAKKGEECDGDCDCTQCQRERCTHRSIQQVAKWGECGLPSYMDGNGGRWCGCGGWDGDEDEEDTTGGGRATPEEDE